MGFAYEYTYWDCEYIVKTMNTKYVHFYTLILGGTFTAKPRHGAMLFSSFGHTNPPPPVPPFLHTQNQSLKDIAGSNFTDTYIAESLMTGYADIGS